MPYSEIARRLYPEIVAGGYSRDDSNVHFYTRIDALLEPDMVVLDVGAGAGVAASDHSTYRRRMRTLRGRASKVIGLDIDPVVEGNPLLDEALVYEAGTAFPLEDASIDLILSDYTFEHIEEPRPFAAEMARVLKPGGWICARTPNRHGYIGVGARLVPNRWHRPVLRRLQPYRTPETVYPTLYRMNTPGGLRALFPAPDFETVIYTHNGTPQYSVDSSMLATRLTLFLYRFLPQALGATLMVFVRKTSA